MTRVDEWARRWTELYARELPREEHERQRDRLYAWADDHGPEEGAACRRGRELATVVYHEDPDIAFGRPPPA